MRQLTSLLDAKPGQTISFYYVGGSTPNPQHPGLRNVKVHKVENGHLYGHDEDIAEELGNYRQYNPDKATEIYLMQEETETKTIHFDEARRELYKVIDNLYGSSLAQCYGKMIVGNKLIDSSFDETTGNITIMIPKREVVNTVKVEIDNFDKVTFIIDGKVQANNMSIKEAIQKVYQIHKTIDNTNE